jgi:hypothetical protein
MLSQLLLMLSLFFGYNDPAPTQQSLLADTAVTDTTTTDDGSTDVRCRSCIKK